MFSYGCVLTHIHVSLASFFVEHGQSMKTKTKSRRMRRLIRVFNVDIQKVLFKFE